MTDLSGATSGSLDPRYVAARRVLLDALTGFPAAPESARSRSCLRRTSPNYLGSGLDDSSGAKPSLMIMMFFGMWGQGMEGRTDGAHAQSRQDSRQKYRGRYKERDDEEDGPDQPPQHNPHRAGEA